LWSHEISRVKPWVSLKLRTTIKIHYGIVPNEHKHGWMIEDDLSFFVSYVLHVLMCLPKGLPVLWDI
jgi:hypothetical protein